MKTSQKIGILLFAALGGALLICAGGNVQKGDYIWAVWCFLLSCAEFVIAWRKLK